MNSKLITMPKYEAYKNSGVDWIGSVPKSWEITRLGMRFSERRAKVSDIDFPPLSVTKRGILPQLENAAKTKDGENRKLVKSGDFVINSRSDRKGSSGVSDRDGSVSLINIVLEPKGIHPKFSEHLLKSYGFVEEYYRVGRGIVADLWTTRYDEMRTITLAVPSYEEQTAIANFLDQKTTQINEAIAIKEKQIALLKERKQIIIQKAVTGEIVWNEQASVWTESAEVKDSGVDWIGQIPEHWKIIKLKHLFREKTVRSTTGTETLFSLRMEIGLVPHNDVSDKYIPSENLVDYKIVEVGQLVMNRMRAAIGIFGLANDYGLVSPDYAVFDVMGDINSHYYLTLFKLPLMGMQFRLKSKGMGTGSSGFMRLYTENFGNIKVPNPPLKEQEELMQFISQTEQSYAIGVLHLQAQIKKLKEYKTTLINSAVTGKIKVA